LQNLLDALQVTPRETRNKKIHTRHVLKFITWTLGINITLVKIIARPKSGHKQFCLCYSFQNTNIKLFNPNHFKPIHVIAYKKKYYILNNSENIFPLLLTGVNPQAEIKYKQIPIRADQILDIVHKNTNHLSFPFTINVYTSYHSVRKTSMEIHKNMIGQLLAKNNTSDVLSVFLTPSLDNKSIVRINTLPTIANSEKFNNHNLFVNSNITEGYKKIFNSEPKEVILNQNYCICDHEDTRIFSPSKQDKHLGKYNTLYRLYLTFLI